MEIEPELEFIALLMELAEIKRLWPVYNSALQNAQNALGIVSLRRWNGYAKISDFESHQAFTACRDLLLP